MGVPWELHEFFRIKIPVNATVYIDLCLDSAGRSSIQLLWSTCKAMAAHFRPYCLEPISSSNKGVSGISKALLHIIGLHIQRRSVLQAGALDSKGTCLTPTHLPKLSDTHSLHRGCFYIRPLLQDLKKYLFCLIYGKHRKSNKMKEHKKIPRRKTLMKWR